MCNISSVSDQWPAVVGQHGRGPFALVSFFHGSNILVESFIVLVADVAKIGWKKIQVRVQEMHFKRHITLHVMESIQHGLDKFDIVRCYVVT